MIRQSHPWKRDLRRLRRQLAKIGQERLGEDMADYKIEKPLLQSAIIVRRLIESWKVTDATKNRRFKVQAYPSRADRAHSLLGLTMRNYIDEEFDLDAPTEAMMDAWGITSELIHSGYINWGVNGRNRFTAIYLASKRNQARRLLRIRLRTYLSILDAIDRDEVERITTTFGEKRELVIAID